MGSDKLTLHNTRHGRNKQKTRDSVKKWKEDKRKKFLENRRKSRESKCPICKKKIVEAYPKFVLEGRNVCFECGSDSINKQKATIEVNKIKNKNKQINDYGYFLWKNDLL